MTQYSLKLMHVHGVPRLDTHVFMPTEQMKLCVTALFDDNSETHIHVFGPRRHGKTTLIGQIKREAEERNYPFSSSDGRLYFRNRDNVQNIVTAIYASVARCRSNQAAIFPDGKELSYAFKDDIKEIDDEDALIDYLFTKLKDLHQRIGKKFTLVCEEIDAMCDDPKYSIFMKFCERHKEMGADSPIKLVTTSLTPLPWISKLQQDFANTVAHVRIKKLEADFTSALSEGIVLRDDREEDVARYLIEKTGGYGGLISEILPRLDKARRFDDAIKEIDRKFEANKKSGYFGGQLGTEEEFLEIIDPETADIFLNIYADLISGPADKVVKIDKTMALHFALSGLADLAEDGVTVGPVAPFIRQVFDHEWIKWQREVEGIGQPRPEDRTPLNCLWGEPQFRCL